MSIRVPHNSIGQHSEVPVVCSACGYKGVLYERSKEVNDALIDSTYLGESRSELALLDRTAALFARFPDSRHALKVGREQLHPKRFPRTTSDPEFEAALAADSELSEFIRRSLFYLPARRQAAIESIQRLNGRDFSAVRCPNCAGGVLRLPSNFFEIL